MTVRGAPQTKEPGLLTWLRIAVSTGALLVALAHVAWPDVVIDATTIALMVIALIPWLAHLVKSLELPGGWKVEFRDLQRAASQAESAGLLSSERAEKDFSFQAVARQDPALALAGLRIEIERRLLRLAQAHAIDLGRAAGIGQLLRALAKADALTTQERVVLSDMTTLLNAAAHGAVVDNRAADWAIDVGPRLLAALDDRIAEAGA